jgi:hypothetical protein
MIQPKVQNLNILRGDTFPLTLTLNFADDPIGAVVNAQAKRNINLDTAIIEWTDIPVVDDGSGNAIADLTKSAAETSVLPVGQFVYDVEIVYPNGNIFTFMKGTITVEGDVTRYVAPE